MNRIHGTSARQLDLIDDANDPIVDRPSQERVAVRMRILRRDLYAELTRRRRRAQIAARHELDKALIEQ